MHLLISVHILAASTQKSRLSHAGIILQRELDVITRVINYTQCDFIGFDYESFGERDVWIDTVHLSRNAENKRRPLEANVTLAVRLAREFLANFSSCISAAKSDARVGVYDLWAMNDHGYQQFSWYCARVRLCG